MPRLIEAEVAPVTCQLSVEESPAVIRFGLAAKHTIVGAPARGLIMTVANEETEPYEFIAVMV
jgi:hypothetical protein